MARSIPEIRDNLAQRQQQLEPAEMLFTSRDYADQLRPLEDGGGDDLGSTILVYQLDALREAKVFAKAQCVPVWRALGVIWFRKTRKRRKPA